MYRILKITKKFSAILKIHLSIQLDSFCFYILAYSTAYGCEHGTLNIECRKGELIRILHGNYGRTNSAICQIENKPHCVSPVADNIIKERFVEKICLNYFMQLKYCFYFSCDLKRSCSVPATNDVFGDPCVGTLKYAEAHYTCWKSKQINDFLIFPYY